jgi:drug/metabolite transporter (DMT)-like permease
MKKWNVGYLYILLCALIFSTMEVMLKTVSGVFAPMQITVLRFLVGGVLLLPFALRSLRARGARLTGRDVLYFLLTGFLCIAFSMVLYQMAVEYTKASVVAVIFSCNPIFVTVLAFLLLREPIRKNQVIALIVEVLAIVIIVNPFHTQLNLTGVILSILSALVFSLYSVIGKKRTPRFGGIAVTCFSFLFGSAELLAVLLLGRTAAVGGLFASLGLDIFVDVPLLSGIPASALPSLFYICAINSAAGYVCHMMAMEKTSAGEASLIFFLKPIFAPIFALVLLHEAIPFNMVLGILCFLVGSAIAIVPGLRASRREAAENGAGH